ncbi:MAG TPA: MBL fold metallo-hydrolase [Gemmatimonadaceae bacterium]|nr:MBL fold metallo-hydrolase [Gemmatimonadaceae bacterium]
MRSGGVALAIGLGALAACAVATFPGYRGPRSDHFDGHRFFNEEPFEEQSPSELARWQLSRHRGAWPDSGAVREPAPPARVGDGELRVTMVNHATVLLQLDSLNILTDPVWSERVGLEGEVGVRRHRAPGIEFDSLPPIDIVLLSHDHYDHMDLPTLMRLQSRDHPEIVTGLGNPAYLATQGVRGAKQLDWWQSMKLGRGVRVTAVPARHWSGRTFSDRYERLWEGFVIEGKRDTVYFAGDTGWGRMYGELHARWSRFTLELLPIAPFRPRWYMARKHLSPDDAVRVAQITRSGTMIPIHWGTFELGDDGESEPVDTLEAAVADVPARCRPRVVVLRNGEHAEIEPLGGGADSLPSSRCGRRR